MPSFIQIIAVPVSIKGQLTKDDRGSRECDHVLWHPRNGKRSVAEKERKPC
jgi:hypothetical protein